jgi:hypothetical protein
MDGENRQRFRIGYEMRHKTRLGRKGNALLLSLFLACNGIEGAERERETRISLVQSIPWTATLSAFFAAPRACSLVLKRESSL